ncbi:hypothetical protein BVRB_028000 [Beta vulgaris subsp. vulgaris]|uniref:Uncharacterized protein n=1 Tax=Beta vulgaris subsp. vulgaris TaxID=3555 RepID=A0A0J8B1K9_BETVV|nr:hypothetical protein BVRB_028000 [Beta vulgaris subsp. vulgaris]
MFKIAICVLASCVVLTLADQYGSYDNNHGKPGSYENYEKPGSYDNYEKPVSYDNYDKADSYDNYGKPSYENYGEPAPCSSEYFHRDGKCGGAEHGYLRCQEGFYCSQRGFCGQSYEYTVNPICASETRPTPEHIKYKKSPDDKNWFQRFFANCFGFLKKDDKKDCSGDKCDY